MDKTQLEMFLDSLEELLETFYKKDWHYRFDVEDSVSISLTVPSLHEEEEHNLSSQQYNERLGENICIKCGGTAICKKDCTLHQCKECNYIQEEWLVEHKGYDKKWIGKESLIGEFLGINIKCNWEES